jgi:thioester reductase-like protein
MTETVLLTGATGYIGGNLLQKRIESSDAKLVLLVRTKRDEDPEARAGKVLASLYASAEAARVSKRIEVVAGDLSVERFGLDDRRYRELAARVTHIIHCGAAARFDLPIEEARKTNVGGTRSILEFARVCGALKRVDYIGTAYVAGARTGIIREDELDVGQSHNNTYERSKMEAEKLVRESMRELPIAILRPSIVICDSRTGRASAFNGFYRALRMYCLGAMQVLPGNPSSVMDLVPVDYVTDAVHAISNDPSTVGSCYHLTAGPDNATPLDEISELASIHFKRERFTIVPPAEFAAYVSKVQSGLGERELDVIKEITLYQPYLTGELRFDNSNTLRKTGLSAPPVRSYFDKMAAYVAATARQ